MSEDHDGPWSRVTPPQRPAPGPATGVDGARSYRLPLALGIAACAALGIWALARAMPSRSVDWSNIAYLVGFAALVGSSLFSRRLQLGQTLIYIAMWVGVFTVLAVGYSFRNEFTDVVLRVRAGLVPGYAITSGGHEMVIGQSEGGGYYIIAQVNGQPVRFAVDTGSTDIVLSPGDAQRLGINTDTLDYGHPSETANGVGYGAAYVVKTLAVGPIQLTDVPVAINKAPMSTSLLGMTFLNRLSSFEVKDSRLYLKGKA